MSDVIIRAENISKQYKIGAQQEPYGSLRESLVRALTAPFRRKSKADDRYIWALKDISFEIKRGEVVGIVGRNGAGKSTLLKILSRITKPTTGHVRMYGRVGSLLEVGTGFHPELTGRENIYLNGAILGMRRHEIEKKFDEIVDFAEIEEFLDTPVKRYSSGMYVRLAFAVAAHLEPEILLVDEVLAVGDAAFQKKCLGKMGEVAQGGRTVLFVSHNMAAVQSLCTNGIMLEKGYIRSHGSISRVVDEYLSITQKANQYSSLSGNRIGDGRAVIDEFIVMSEVVQTGNPTSFILKITRADDVKNTLEVELAISFLSGYYEPLFQLFSQHMGKTFLLSSKYTKIKVNIDSLPLAPGNYHLNLWLGSGQVPIDWVTDCYVLTVYPGSFEEGVFVENRGYPMVVPSTWEELTI